MQRDMELIREILLQVQSRKDVNQRELSLPDRDPVLVNRHFELLFEARLLDGTKHANSLDETMQFWIRDLTWDGHEFIAVLENKGVWEKIKQTFSPAELATFPLAVIKTAGAGLLLAYAKNKLGLP